MTSPLAMGFSSVRPILPRSVTRLPERRQAAFVPWPGLPYPAASLSGCQPVTSG